MARILFLITSFLTAGAPPEQQTQGHQSEERNVRTARHSQSCNMFFSSQSSAGGATTGALFPLQSENTEKTASALVFITSVTGVKNHAKGNRFKNHHHCKTSCDIIVYICTVYHFETVFSDI